MAELEWNDVHIQSKFPVIFQNMKKKDESKIFHSSKSAFLEGWQKL